jgi:hypothetical protein
MGAAAIGREFGMERDVKNSPGIFVFIDRRGAKSESEADPSEDG